MLIHANQSVRMLLKCVHIFSVCVWIGGGLAVLVLLYNDKQTSNGDELFAYNHAIKSIDNFLIKPSAVGAFASGTLICLLTNLGLTKHRWIIAKWAITLAAIGFGALFLGPWLKDLSTITGLDRMAVFDDSGYFHTYQLGVAFGLLQTGVLLVLVLISIFKPSLGAGRNVMGSTKPEKAPRHPSQSDENAATKASTTTGSNWVPLQRLSSAMADSLLKALR